MKDHSDLLWVLVAGGAGYMAWRAWKDHQAASTIDGSVSPAAPAPYVPLVLPTPNLMAPAPIVPTPVTPAAPAPAPAPAAANDSNATFAASMAAAHESQNTYYDQVQNDFAARVSAGALVPGTPAYASELAYAINRNGVAGQAAELARLQAAGVA